MTRTPSRFPALRAPIAGAAAAPATARSSDHTTAPTTHAFASAGEIAVTTPSARPDATNTSANTLNAVPIDSSLTPDAGGHTLTSLFPAYSYTSPHLNGVATTGRG
ncbi:hypothetical protein [Streptomyces sp. HPF1205]|uniref:hypothetical protein n=1 Tax=Streptomyces sp. HPF1205 TaxID=2873262 RepID=UPI001CED145D|nr:hypothetical protein [Streptomyces sp. HPF1205]